MSRIKEYIRRQFDAKKLLLGYTHGYPNLILVIMGGSLGLAILVGIALLISVLFGG